MGERPAGPDALSRALLRVLLIVAVVVAAVWLLDRLAGLLFILLLSGLFAYAIAPLVDAARRPLRIRGRQRCLSRAMAVLCVYVLIASVLSAAGALVVPRAVDQGRELLGHAPEYGRSISTWEHGWARYYERMRLPSDLRQGIDQGATSAAEAVSKSARTAVGIAAAALAALPWLLLIPILAFFLLKDGSAMRAAALAELPQASRQRGARLFDDLNAALAAFIRAQILACAIVGLACGIGFAILGIPYFVVFGVLAALLEFIPLIGPLTVAVVVAVVAGFHSLWLALAVLGFLGVLRVLEDYVIYPRLMRRSVELHPLVIILAVLAGGELSGISGMFLAVPLTAIASLVFRHWREWRRLDAGADAVAQLALVQPEGGRS